MGPSGPGDWKGPPAGWEPPGSQADRRDKTQAANREAQRCFLPGGGAAAGAFQAFLLLGCQEGFWEEKVPFKFDSWGALGAPGGPWGADQV